jgi:predicted site-specific integrase-resolvase
MRNGLNVGDQLIGPSETATLLGVSRRTLRRCEINGLLRPVKLNKRVTRYRLGDVLRLLGKEVES